VDVIGLLAAEIEALKSQLAALGSAPRPTSPIRRPFAPPHCELQSKNNPLRL
jgi:hypothetical protein